MNNILTPKSIIGILSVIIIGVLTYTGQLSGNTGLSGILGIISGFGIANIPSKGNK